MLDFWARPPRSIAVDGVSENATLNVSREKFDIFLTDSGQ